MPSENIPFAPRPASPLLVAETGTPAPNTGRVSIVDSDGNRRTLLDGLARGGVIVFVMAEPEGIWAHYDNQAKVIGLDRSLLGTDPRTLATILSHEATHALSDLSGMVTQAEQQVGVSGACYADEYQATLTEVQVWQQFWGSQGRPYAQHPYERQENRELARYLRSPQGFAARLVAEYGFECGR